MFERFNDRARKVMALANQEAQRVNHEYTGTEHILLGADVVVLEGARLLLGQDDYLASSLGESLKQRRPLLG